MTTLTFEDDLEVDVDDDGALIEARVYVKFDDNWMDYTDKILASTYWMDQIAEKFNVHKQDEADYRREQRWETDPCEVVEFKKLGGV